MENTTDSLYEKHIIAAVRSKKEFDAALKSRVDNIFLLAGSILTVPDYIAAANAAHKRLFLHMDMIDGLGRDTAAVEYIAHLAPYGVISTHGNLIKGAKKLGLYTVQRFFIVDGQSLGTALDTVRQTKPTYAELMPGSVYRAIRAFGTCGIPVIAGGLISTPGEAMLALKAGASAVSTSCAALW